MTDPHLQFRFLTFSHFQVLLVSGTRGWIIPGGKVEPMEVDDPSFAAVREAREEGGVRGELECRLCPKLSKQVGHNPETPQFNN